MASGSKTLANKKAAAAAPSSYPWLVALEGLVANKSNSSLLHADG